MSSPTPRTPFLSNGRLGVWVGPGLVVVGGLILTALLVSSLRRVDNKPAALVAKEIGRRCKHIPARFAAVVAELSRVERWVAIEPGLTDAKWEQWFENSVRPAFPEILELGYAPVVRHEKLPDTPLREDDSESVPDDDMELPVQFLATVEAPDYPGYFRAGIASGSLIGPATAGRDSGDVLVTLQRTLATGATHVSALLSSRGQQASSNSLPLICLYQPSIHIAPEPVRATNVTGIFFVTLNLDQMVADEVGDFTPGIYCRYRVQNDDSTWTTANGTRPEPADGLGSPKIVVEQTSTIYGRRFHWQYWIGSVPGNGEVAGRARTAGAVGTLLTGLLAGMVWNQGRIRRNETLIAAELTETHSRLAAAIHERERLSRDLHDGTIQSIYAVGFDLQRVRNLIGLNPEAARTELTRTLATLNNVVMELREFILQSEPGADPSHQNVDTVLQALVERVRRNTHAEILLELSPDAARFVPPRQVVELLQIVREAVTNSLHHGYPRQIGIALTRDGGDWRLTIADDGTGFDPQRASDHDGHGLRNLHNRAAELGGECEIVSAPGTGTAVRVVFPVLHGALESQPAEGKT